MLWTTSTSQESKQLLQYSWTEDSIFVGCLSWDILHVTPTRSFDGRGWNNSLPVYFQIYWSLDDCVQPVLTDNVPFLLCVLFSLYTLLFQVKTRHNRATLLCLLTADLWCHINPHDSWRDQNVQLRPTSAAPAPVCSWRVHQWVQSTFFFRSLSNIPKTVTWGKKK